MRKLFVMLSCILLAACGGGGGGTSATTPNTLKVIGTATEGAVIANKIVKLKDANGVSATDTTTSATGTYSIDVTGLTAPYILTVTGTNGTYVSLAPVAGTANINPITTTVVALAAATSDISSLFSNLTPTQVSNINTNYPAKSALVTTSLQSALPSGTTAANYFTGAISVGSGIDAVFDTYRITVSSTTGITVKTNDTIATTVFTIPTNTIAANTNQPLPTISVFTTAMISGKSFAFTTSNGVAGTIIFRGFKSEVQLL